MFVKHRTRVVHVLLIFVVALLLSAVGAGWKWHVNAPTAGWTWDPDSAASVYVQE